MLGGKRLHKQKAIQSQTKTKERVGHFEAVSAKKSIWATTIDISKKHHSDRKLEISSQKVDVVPSCQGQHNTLPAGSTSGNKYYSLNVGGASRGPLRRPSSFSLRTLIASTC
ncbi:hypothetical protein VNO78_08532 [Psophocarpus tetragonolobus]|uniref:Uncharacterized protein n=1 Tax=Psophocarpus tetragonolobus TaxID=3891 RepID=A0AAN9XTU5_PSOTE